MQKVMKDLEYIYFFKEAFGSKLYFKPWNDEKVSFTKEEVEEAKQFIKDEGTSFYTVDDDDLDKTEGHYYGVGGIDFEPLDKMQADSGHTKLYYKAISGWSQL
jgi:hypothetical protein